MQEKFFLTRDLKGELGILQSRNGWKPVLGRRVPLTVWSEKNDPMWVAGILEENAQEFIQNLNNLFESVRGDDWTIPLANLIEECQKASERIREIEG